MFFFKKPSPTVADVMPDFIASREAKGLRDATLLNYRVTAQMLIREWGTRPIAKITAADVMGIFDRCSRNAAEDAIVVMRWAFRRRLIDVELSARHVLPEVPRRGLPHADYWPAAEAHAFLDAVEEPYRAAFIIGLFAGLRPFELCRIVWSDIDFEDRIIHIRPAVSKVRRHRKIETEEVQHLRLYGHDIEQRRKPGIPARIWTLLEPYRHRKGYVIPTAKTDRDDHAVCSTVLGKARRAAAKKSGSHLSHDIVRHTFATHLVALKQDLSLTAKVLGHVGLGMLEAHYDGSGTRADAEDYFGEPRMIREFGAVLDVTPESVLTLATASSP